jgi:hypothetical protein
METASFYLANSFWLPKQVPDKKDIVNSGISSK